MRPGSWEVTVVCVEDALDPARLSCVKDRLGAVLERDGDVVLDLRRARVDGAGLGVILSLQRQLELRERRLLVVTQGASLITLLDAAGAAGALALFPDVEAAAQEARRGAAAPLAPRLETAQPLPRHDRPVCLCGAWEGHAT